MLQIQIYRFGVARFFLGLYIALLANGVMFRHAHRLADGSIICHAHPYKGSPGTQFPNHTHSRDELIWFDAFSNLLYDAPGLQAPLTLVIALVLLAVGVTQPVLFSRSSAHTAFRHRGPPCLA